MKCPYNSDNHNPKDEKKEGKICICNINSFNKNKIILEELILVLIISLKGIEEQKLLNN